MSFKQPAWMIGLILVCGTIGLAFAIAIGSVKPESSFGLPEVLHTLELLCAQFAAWAFFVKKE
jgi:hypothetical protein